jgi:flagellar motility protein MotE (MotC chaperone)
VRTRRDDNVYLMADDMDEGPTAGIVAELPPEVAATLLGSLPKPVAAGILAEWPPDKAQAVLVAMYRLTGTALLDAEQDSTSAPAAPLRAVQEPTS